MSDNPGLGTGLERAFDMIEHPSPPPGARLAALRAIGDVARAMLQARVDKMEADRTAPEASE